MSACTEPIPWPLLVDYWAGDLPEAAADAVETHLFGCAECTEASSRVASVSEAIRGMIAPVISGADLTRLRARGLRVTENPMQPGERREVVFPEDTDVLVHRLEGLDLDDVSRIDFVLRDEVSGRVLVTVANAPFDRDSGCVLVACQKHYASLPPDDVAELRLDRGAGDASHVAYTILHRYA